MLIPEILLQNLSKLYVLAISKLGGVISFYQAVHVNQEEKIFGNSLEILKDHN